MMAVARSRVNRQPAREESKLSNNGPGAERGEDMMCSACMAR